MKKFAKIVGICVITAVILVMSVMMAAAMPTTVEFDENEWSRNLNGLAVTPETVRISRGSGRNTAESGNIFVSIVIKVENNTNESMNVFNFDFDFFADNRAVSDSFSAQRYMEAQTGIERLSATLAPGTHAIGIISAEVAEDTQVLRADFSRGWGNNERSTTFNFNIQELKAQYVAASTPAPDETPNPPYDNEEEPDDEPVFDDDLNADWEFEEFLTGSWAWVENREYILSFAPNGNSTSGYATGRTRRTWHVNNGRLYMNNQHIPMEINGNRITLTRLGGVYTYERYSDDYNITGTYMLVGIIGFACCVLVVVGVIILIIVLVSRGKNKRNNTPPGFGPPQGFNPTQPPQPPVGGQPGFGPPPPPAAPPGQQFNQPPQASVSRCTSCGAVVNGKTCEYCGTRN